VLVDSLLAGGYEEIARDSAPSCLMGCVPTALESCLRASVTSTAVCRTDARKPNLAAGDRLEE